MGLFTISDQFTRDRINLRAEEISMFVSEGDE